MRSLTGSRLRGRKYRVAFTLYSRDGRREVEVLEFDNGETYLVERECLDGMTFADRHAGKMVGPFESPQSAEKFIVTTDWFCGCDNSR